MMDKNEMHRIAVEGGSRAAEVMDDLFDKHARLLDAAKAALPWAGLAMVGRRDKRPEFDAHPQAVKNHEEAVQNLIAAITESEADDER